MSWAHISNKNSLYSLKVKMAAVLGLVVAILILTSGVLIVRYSYQALRLQKQQDELVMAKNIAIQVEEVLADARKTVEALARMPSIQTMNPDQQIDVLTIVTQTTELIDGIVITNLDGKTMAIDGELNTERIIPQGGYKKFSQEISRSPGSVISEVYLSKSNQLCVAINAPIFQGNNAIGMVSGGILLRNHSMGGIDNIRIGNTGYAYVVDASGDVIIHPEGEKILEDFSENPAVKELLSKMKPGVIEFENQEGILILAAFAPIVETGWGVVVRQPASESYAFAEHIRKTHWIFLACGVVMALGFGFLLAGYYLRPISELTHAVQKVTQGDLNITIEPKTRDEVGELAKGFNEMTLALKKHLRKIEESHKNVLESQMHLARSEKLASVGQLAAGLAHEINNPINVIMGFSEMLLKQLGPDHPKRNYVEEIDREANRCGKLVQTLLRFARQKEMVFEKCNINNIVDDVLLLVRDRSENSGIVVNYQPDKNIHHINGDEDQLKQVILNIVLNACQAMPKGGELTIRTENFQANGSVAIRVSDSGLGIKPENRDKIFSPFFTTKDQGTGLGLAVSYAIVEQHGGKIIVESVSPHGATFIVVLPKEVKFPGNDNNKDEDKTS